MSDWMTPTLAVSAISALAGVTSVVVAMRIFRHTRGRSSDIPMVRCALAPIPDQPNWHLLSLSVINYSERNWFIDSLDLRSSKVVGGTLFDVEIDSKRHPRKRGQKIALDHCKAQRKFLIFISVPSARWGGPTQFEAVIPIEIYLYAEATRPVRLKMRMALSYMDATLETYFINIKRTLPVWGLTS